MFFSTALSLLLLASVANADVWTCKLDDLRIMKTDSDYGPVEEWRIQTGALYFNAVSDNTLYKNDYSGSQDVYPNEWSLKNYYGNDCNPPVSTDDTTGDGFYGCDFYWSNSQAGGKWCVQADNQAEASFYITMYFRIGDIDGNPDYDWDDEPVVWDLQSWKIDLPYGNSDPFETYTTRTSSDEKHKGRIYILCEQDRNGVGCQSGSGTIYMEEVHVRQNVGESCSWNNICSAGLDCNGGTCVAAADNGDDCGSNSECKSWNCDLSFWNNLGIGSGECDY